MKNSTFHIVDLYKRKCKACIFLKEPFYWIARLGVGVYKTVEYGHIAGSQEAITQMGGQAIYIGNQSYGIFYKIWMD